MGAMEQTHASVSETVYHGTNAAMLNGSVKAPRFNSIWLEKRHLFPTALKMPIALFLFLAGMFGQVFGADDPSLAITLEAQTHAPQLRITGTAGTSCQIEYTDELSSATSWQVLSNVTLSSTSSQVIDRTVATGHTRFYRTARTANDSGLLIWLKFDGSLQGADGEMPLSQQGASYRTGMVGQAVYLNATGRIRYPIASNLYAHEGTIEFWIQPDWDGTNKDVRVFFEAGDNFNKGMLLSKDGASNLRFLQWGDDPATPTVEIATERGLGFSGQNWVKGQWYHLAATWNGTTRDLAFYLNGEAIQTETNGAYLSSFSTTFFVVGAEIDNAHPSVAAFDELRVFNRMRTAAQIWQDYHNPAGPPN